MSSERSIVFAQANNVEFRPYVVMFLHASGQEAANDISSRSTQCPDVGCLDLAPIHNIKTEALFAHQAYAAQSTRAQHNRLRGMALCKASGTFALESKLRQSRRKKFLHNVKRSKARMEDWIEEHKDDRGFLSKYTSLLAYLPEIETIVFTDHVFVCADDVYEGLFNKKYISEQRRCQIIQQALSGRRDKVCILRALFVILWNVNEGTISFQKNKTILGKRSLIRLQLQAQDENVLRKKEENNASLIRIHQAKVVEHLKLRKRRRFISVKELEEFMSAKDLLAGILLVV
jgi:hypothetical protein